MKKANTQCQDNKTVKTLADQIKLAIDVHAEKYVVVRQIDNSSPQPAQTFTPENFLKWAAKQLTQAREVYSCYEAGCFGYVLHRKLVELGIRNIVIRPQNWDELHKGVKTDKSDVLGMSVRLDRYVQGNQHALAVVNVPTVEQELARAQGRFREQLSEHRKRLEAQGRSLLLLHGVRLKTKWWEPAAWKGVGNLVAVEVLEILTGLRTLILAVDEQLKTQSRKIAQSAEPQPLGFGQLTSELLKREICDWNRFSNRRQVASMTGLCPGVYASGQTFRQGSITRHGNKHVRWLLVELAWRILRYQRNYAPARQAIEKMAINPKNRALRKKTIVALARKLAIDLWRIETGRSTPEKLGLKMN